MKVFRQWRAKRAMLKVAQTMKRGGAYPDGKLWPCPIRVVFGWGLSGYDRFGDLFTPRDASTVYYPADRFRSTGKESDRAACIAAIKAL